MTEDIRQDVAARIGPQLQFVLPPQGGPLPSTSTIADRLVLELISGLAWNEPLGVCLPGLLIDSELHIPRDHLSARTWNALTRFTFMTWRDLADMTLADLADLRSVGPYTLTEILRLAIARALSASAVSHANGIRGDEQLESALEKQKDEPPQHSLPARIGNALETLTAWGRRERGVTTLGALLAEVGRATDMPEDVAQAWAILDTCWMSNFAGPVADTPLAELFDGVLTGLDEREREIFVSRSIMKNNATLQELADRWRVTRERIRQIQVAAESKVAAAVAQERFAPLRWRAQTLRSLLGASISMASDAYTSALNDVLGDCHVGSRSMLMSFLLNLAGYAEKSGWMVRKDAVFVTSKTLEDAADEFGIIDTSHVTDLLREAGIATGDHAAILERIGGFREFGGRLAIWKGTVADKAVRVLAVCGKPMTPEELVAAIGEGNPVRALRNRILEDRRLARVTKNEWALRVWGLPEYTGIADKIAEEIEKQGGTALLAKLVDMIASQFGVAARSVRAYAQTPRFVVQGEIIRLRAATEPVVVSAQIADAKGCFQVSATSVSFCLGVDKEVQRGSGRSLPMAVAAFVGVVPGKERRFHTLQTPHGDVLSVVVTWPIDSVSGPTLGSTRTLVVDTGAEEGDLLRLQFDRVAGTVHAVRLIPKELNEAARIVRLSALTGIMGLDDLTAPDLIAAAIGVAKSEVRSRLHRRGDDSLVELLPVTSVDPELDAALAELGAALESGI